MKQLLHTESHFDSLPLKDPSEVALRIEALMPEVYDIFNEYQRALVEPYIKRDGVLMDDVYDQLLPVAAQLTMATAIVAQSSKSDD